MTIEELKTEVFGKHWQDESWHEVLRLIVGMIDTSFSGQIIDYLMEQDGEAQKFINLFLAAQCLSDVKNRQAIYVIDTKLLNCLKTLFEYGDYFQTSSDKEPSSEREIYTQAVAAIATTWKGSKETLPWLKALYHSTHYWAVQHTVVQEIVKDWAIDPDILPALKTRAQFDGDSCIRIAAIEALFRRWTEDPDILPILKASAQGDRELNVRRTAVHALASVGKSDPDTLSILKVCACSDNAWQVRRAGVLELGKEWKDEPDIFEFLCERAVNDPFKDQQYWLNPRLLALKIIIKQYPDHPQTIPILQDRAENDLDELVREFAKKKLAELEKHN